jgi:maltose alpha-D-glucosyltransferase / alpha-amylase
MRKEAPEIGWGDFTCVETGRQGVLALRYDWRNNSILIVHNLDEEPAEVEIDPGLGEAGRLLVDIADGSDSQAGDDCKHCVFSTGSATDGFASAALIISCAERRFDHNPSRPAM